MGRPPPQGAFPDPRRSPRSQIALSLPRRFSDRLRRELAGEAPLVLILDYDGTLTPIVPSPRDARLADSPRETLKRLANHPRVRLAILSGRSLPDVRARVGLKNVVYGGCHGLEIDGPGVRFRHPNARAGAARIRAVTRVLARQLRRFPGANLELKGQTVAVHYLRVPQRRRGELLKLGAQVERAVPGLVCLAGKNVLEFLPRVKWGKGQATLWIARQLATAFRPRRAVILYAGDDASDEAAFAALKGRGIGVRIGARRGPADFAVKNVSGLHALLRWLLRIIE